MGKIVKELHRNFANLNLHYTTIGNSINELLSQSLLKFKVEWKLLASAKQIETVVTADELCGSFCNKDEIIRWCSHTPDGEFGFERKIYTYMLGNNAFYVSTYKWHHFLKQLQCCFWNC